MVGEEKKEEIRKEAKKILDSFAKSLDKVKFRGKGLKEEVGGFRKEEAGKKSDSDFRKNVLENAPEKDGDCIIAEKKKW